jgi:hypothetical protein
MSKCALGIFVAFTAMGHITIETESVIETFGLLIGILYTLFAQCLKRLKFAALNLEVGHDRTALILGCHLGILLISN